jgi:hypothetical protein
MRAASRRKYAVRISASARVHVRPRSSRSTFGGSSVTVHGVHLLTVIGLVLLVGVVGCSTPPDPRRDVVSTTGGWRDITIGDVARLTVPGDAREQNVQPIDSIVGIVRGEAYEIVYDYGRYGERLETYDGRPGHTVEHRNVDGRTATEISFQGDRQPWSAIHILQVQDGANLLTIRLSCADGNPCGLADTVFDSVRFTPH